MSVLFVLFSVERIDSLIIFLVRTKGAISLIWICSLATCAMVPKVPPPPCRDRGFLENVSIHRNVALVGSNNMVEKWTHTTHNLIPHRFCEFFQPLKRWRCETSRVVWVRSCCSDCWSDLFGWLFGLVRVARKHLRKPIVVGSVRSCSSGWLLGFGFRTLARVVARILSVGLLLLLSCF